MPEIQLRNGSTTNDRRLDRLPQFDERSRNFPIRATIAAQAKPRSYTWAIGACLDQGPDGACVGFAMVHEALARPAVYRSLDAKYAKELYWKAQRIDPWEGGSYPGARPFYEGTSVLAGVTICQKELHFFDEYRWAFGLDDLRLAIGYKGPAVLGINWYSGMFQPDSSGYIHVNGVVEGGHAILNVSNSEKEKRFTLHNSWGANWGRHGQAYISYDDMGRLLAEDGEACIPMLRKQQVKA